MFGFSPEKSQELLPPTQGDGPTFFTPRVDDSYITENLMMLLSQLLSGFLTLCMLDNFS